MKVNGYMLMTPKDSPDDGYVLPDEFYRFFATIKGATDFVEKLQKEFPKRKFFVVQAKLLIATDSVFRCSGDTDD